MLTLGLPVRDEPEAVLSMAIQTRKSQMKRLVTLAILTVIAITAVPSPVHAKFELRVQEYDSLGNAVGAAQIFSGSEPGSGVGMILGASGTTANFVFSFNASQNANAPAIPSLHLDSFTIGTSAPTTDYLVIGLTEGGAGHGYANAGPNPLAVISNLSSIAGIGNATVTLQSFADANNNPYGVPVGTTVPPPGNPFVPPLVGSAGAIAAPTITMNSSNSGSGITTISGPFNASGPFSVTQVATVTGLANGQTISFNDTTTVVPAPAGLLLALTGLPALGVYYRRRMKKLTPA
jgi:hypothetical protein